MLTECRIILAVPVAASLAGHIEYTNTNTECKIILAVPVAVPLAGHIEYTNTNTNTNLNLND